MIFSVPGYPSEIGEALPAAAMGALLCAPIFHRASLELFKSVAAPFQLELLAAAPLRRTFRYTYVDSCVQFLEPGVAALGSRTGHGLYDWHVDGFVRPEEATSIFHVYCSAGSSCTEFNSVPSEIEALESHVSSINDALGSPRYASKFRPKAMPPEKFVTFSTHVHRAARPTSRELRFYFRITESDWMRPNEDPRARLDHSVAHVEGQQGLVRSVEQRAGGLWIRVPSWSDADGVPR